MEEDPRIGSVLAGRYRLIEELAAGGMGVVYRAERVGLGRPVAVKFLHPWMAAEERARKRFEIEARAMARLQHPSCAAVIDFGLEDDAPYVVMDYFEGETLREILDRGPLEPARALSITRQILAGLTHAHGLGIVHRDMKPANVMVGQAAGIGDQVKLLDFGLAKLREGAPQLTAGLAVGTPAYMAPEQIMSEEVDARTDVYAVGILLFEMLTGDKPFAAESPGEVLQMHRESPRPHLSDATSVRRFSAALDEVVRKAMAIAPDERFAGAAELGEALARTPEAHGGAAPLDPGPRTQPLPAVEAGQGSATAAAPGTGGAAPGASPPPPAAAPSPPAVAPSPPAAAPSPPAAWGYGPTPGARRPWRWAGLGAGILALVVIGVVAATVGDEPAPAAEPAREAPMVLDEDPVGAPDLSDVLDLVERGEHDAAIAELQAAARSQPRVAAYPYWLGRLYFERLWWRDGIDAYRRAIRLEPSYREDPELIKSVLRGFLVTRDVDANIAALLRDDIGAPAVPYLRETAADHPDPRRRERASRLLDQIR